MTAAEYQQQQEEEAKQETSVILQDEYGKRVRLHIWGDDESVFINMSNYPLSFSLSLDKNQAGKMLEMLNNAWRAK